MLAAVFFIMNLENPGSGTASVWGKVFESVVAMAAMLSYGALTLQASRSLANPQRLTGDEEVEFKKRQTRRVLGIFWVMLVITGFLVVIRVVAPAILEAIETIGEPEATQAPPARQLPKNGSPPPDTSQREGEPARSTSPTEDPPPADKQQGDEPTEPAEHGGASPDRGFRLLLGEPYDSMAEHPPQQESRHAGKHFGLHRKPNPLQ